MPLEQWRWALSNGPLNIWSHRRCVVRVARVIKCLKRRWVLFQCLDLSLRELGNMTEVEYTPRISKDEERSGHTRVPHSVLVLATKEDPVGVREQDRGTWLPVIAIPGANMSFSSSSDLVVCQHITSPYSEACCLTERA